MASVIRFFTKDLKLRAASVVSTELVQAVVSRKPHSPSATIALGRLITGAVLMASQQKEGQRIGIKISGDGPLGVLFADASFEGKARGYCQNPSADVRFDNGAVDVAKAVGKGTLTVTRALPFQKQPHHGIVPLNTGEISQDIAYYYQQSQQTPCIVALTVSLNPDFSVKSAGGALLELMPGPNENLIRTLEKNSKTAPSFSKILETSDKPEEAMIRAFLPDAEIMSVLHPHDVEFYCACTMERVERTLTLLGRPVLAEMVLKGDPIHVNCEFCQREFVVAIETLKDILSIDSSHQN